MLNPEEVERLKDQELLRLQLRRELDPQKHRGVWDWLNSQLAIWFLSSVVLSGITYYWNHRNDERVAQREDSQFVATLIPYLANTDLTVRLRAVDAIKIRYPEDKIPPAVQRLILSVVVEATSIPSSKQPDQTKRLVASAVRMLDKLAKPDPSVSAALQQIPVRVYLKISDDTQRAIAQKFQSSLEEQGFLVAGIETFARGAGQFEARTQVRHFDESTKATADQVYRLLVQNGFSSAEVVHAKKTIGRSGTAEVWFSPPTILVAPKMLEGGEVRGVNFGTARGFIYVHPRVIPSHRSGRYVEEPMLADRLLGMLNASNWFPLDGSYIQKWDDSTVQLKIPTTFGQDLVDGIIGTAQSREMPLKRSDVEFGYQVVTADGTESEWFYP